MATYPEVARSLLAACRAYRDGGLALELFKAEVLEAANEIVDVQERWTRDFLQTAEGRLDMVEYTRNPDEVLDASLSVVDEIEDAMRRYLEGP